MKKETKKKINDFEKRALMWSDVEGADELKNDFDKFNAYYKIVEKEIYCNCNRDKTIFTFCNDLVRHMYNKPYCAKWETIPEELTEYYDRVLNKMNDFINRGLVAAAKEGFLPRWNRSFGYDENNTALEVAGYASYNRSFREKISFKDDKDKTITFEVCYGDLKAEQCPYFSTTANSRDESGQAQDRLLPEGTVVRAFWEKWDMYHCQMLTRSEYDEMLKDLEIVKADPLAMNEEV